MIMNQEEKQLLLKDLCARLPYGIKVHHYQGSNCILKSIDLRTYAAYVEVYEVMFFKKFIQNGQRSIFEYKPYLRPMSSMTEEEKEEFDNLYNWSCPNSKFLRTKIIDVSELVDWLNAHHFDYRGLIEKGLALEAPDGMYDIN